MNPLPIKLPPEAQALLDRERSIPVIPAPVRARAIARAREALAAGNWGSTKPPRAAVRTLWAAAVVLACFASAVVGAMAYGLRAHSEAARSSGPVVVPVEMGAPAPGTSAGGNLGAATAGGFGDEDDVDDEVYEAARAEVMQSGKASTSYLQRKLRIGYSRAARLMDVLEERGVIGPGDGAKPREILDKSGTVGSASPEENL